LDGNWILHSQFLVTLHSSALDNSQLQYTGHYTRTSARARARTHARTHTHTHTHTESSRSAAPHQSSGTGFQQQTFPFLGSRTVAVLQPQRLLTHSALTNSILLAPLDTLKIFTPLDCSRTAFTFAGYEHMQSNNY
jgi:hypothetical protein